MTTKEYVLRLLEEHKGSPLSGSQIAAKLGVSRAAVWKAVQSLLDCGYPITAANNRGYCLEATSDILSRESILPYLHNPAFYPEIRVLDSVDSTNQEAKKRAHNGAPSGTVILAEQQTAGRGRLGRSFFSPAGSGIYLSVVFRLDFSIDVSLLLTSAAAVAVCRAICSVTGLEAQIKWVNDIYLDGKKICGILTEASMNFENQQLEYLVVGIGINVRTGSFPPEVEKVATALEPHLEGRRISRSELIGAVLNELETVLKQLENQDFLEEYRERSFVLGKRISVITPQEIYPAVAQALNNQGHLIVQREDNGETAVLNTGEISIRRMEA